MKTVRLIFRVYSYLSILNAGNILKNNTHFYHLFSLVKAHCRVLNECSCYNHDHGTTWTWTCSQYRLFSCCRCAGPRFNLLFIISSLHNVCGLTCCVVQWVLQEVVNLETKLSTLSAMFTIRWVA